jgi:hypothetical protein
LVPGINPDILFSVVVAVATAALAMMGGLVSVRPPKNLRYSRLWKWAFAVVATVGVSAQITQQVRTAEDNLQQRFETSALRDEIRRVVQAQVVPPPGLHRSASRLSAPSKQESTLHASPVPPPGVGSESNRQTLPTPTAALRAVPSFVAQPQAERPEASGRNDKSAVYTSDLENRAGFMSAWSYQLLGCMIQFNRPEDHRVGAEYCAAVYGPDIIAFDKELNNLGIGNRELDAMAKAIRNGVTYDELNKAPELLEQITTDILAKKSKGK